MRQVEATIVIDQINLLHVDTTDLVRDTSLNDHVELRVLGDVGAKIRVLNFDSPGIQVISKFSSLFYSFKKIFLRDNYT